MSLDASTIRRNERRESEDDALTKNLRGALVDAKLTGPQHKKIII